MDAFTARLIPGDARRPRRARGVRHDYIDHKLARFAVVRDADVLPAAVRQAGEGRGGSGPHGDTILRRQGTSCRATGSSRADTAGGVPQGPRGARHARARHGSRSPQLGAGRRTRSRTRLQRRRLRRRSLKATTGRSRAGSRASGRALLQDRVLLDAAGRHERGDVLRPGLRRQPRLRRLEADRLPRRAARLHGRRAKHGPQHDASRACATCRR